MYVGLNVARLTLEDNGPAWALLANTGNRLHHLPLARTPLAARGRGPDRPDRVLVGRHRDRSDVCPLVAEARQGRFWREAEGEPGRSGDERRVPGDQRGILRDRPGAGGRGES